MRARRSPLAAPVAALAAAALASGCAVGTEDTARPRADVPFGLLDRGQPVVLPSPQEPTGGTFTTCFPDADGDLVTVRVPALTDITPLSAIETLAALPAADEELTTAVPDEPVVDDVEVSAGRATVALSQAFGELVPRGEQLMFVAQVVCTLTALPGIGQVLFTRDGQPLDVPTGDGALATGAVSRDDYEELFRPAE